ncbi:class I SAM-dependent methyltransferase [Planctomycetota bacterium]
MRYDDRYWERSEHLDVYDESQDIFFKELEDYLPVLYKYYPGRGLLLDVGCGTGEFLRLAQKDGWQVSGVEPAPNIVEILRGKFAVPVYQGFFEKVEIASESIDCLTMWDVIEHLYDPGSALKKVSELLKPGGIFVFKTPNERSLFKRLPLFLYKMTGGLFNSLLKFVYYDPHYYSYSVRCCRKMLARYGFEIEHIRLESTNMAFARKKLDLSYSRYPWTLRFVKLCLPLAISLATLTGRQNKIIVVARKI